MKTFKQLRKTVLCEMPKLISTVDKKASQLGGQETKLQKHDNPTKVGKMASGHHLYQSSYREGRSYSAVDPKTKTIDMKVTGAQEDGSKHFRVGMVRGREGSPIKAHEFYHHLVTKHGITLQSDTEHSPGAKHTWKKLSEYPDVEITHHHANLGPQVMHHGDDFDKNYTNMSHFIAKKKNG